MEAPRTRLRAWEKEGEKRKEEMQPRTHTPRHKHTHTPDTHAHSKASRSDALTPQTCEMNRWRVVCWLCSLVSVCAR